MVTNATLLKHRAFTFSYVFTINTKQIYSQCIIPEIHKVELSKDQNNYVFKVPQITELHVLYKEAK